MGIYDGYCDDCGLYHGFPYTQEHCDKARAAEQRVKDRGARFAELRSQADEKISEQVNKELPVL